MSSVERVFHAVLFEILAVMLSIMGLVIFTDHQISALSHTMLIIAIIAMLWNFVFNTIFDHYIHGQRENRSWSLRIIHGLLFEGGLLFITVPVMAHLLNTDLWHAFMLDIGVTIFITFYTLVYNYAYDHIRIKVRRHIAI